MTTVETAADQGYWVLVHARSPVTTFESMARQVLLEIHPGGSARNYFTAPRGADCYRRAVKPDFVLPDGRWIDFKYHVSYREKSDVPWRPSALYSSLRKYIDHVSNKHGMLIVVYGHLHGSLRDVSFPICRGTKVLIANAAEFADRIKLLDIRRLAPRLAPSRARWLAETLSNL